MNWLEQPRVVIGALGAAMLASAALVLYVTSGQGFAVDELYYYARVATKDGDLAHFSSIFTPEYLLAPFNGHLALGGRLVYETVFATIGAHYTVLVLINIAGLCTCAALVFLLIRPRLGNLAALAPCILILFLGFAREQLLWPLDFNTSFALAAGLGAVLAMKREDRRGDIAACILLAVSIAMIEIGLAFMAGIVLMIILQSSRWRRIWIVLTPLVLYIAWWWWARRFGQNETELSNLILVPKTFFNAAAVVLGSMTGTNPVIPASYGTEITWFGRALAVLAAVALVLRIRRGSLPITFWVWLVVTACYWSLLAIADRGPQGSRYILVGVVMAILIAADSVRQPLSRAAAAAVFAIVFVALPANIDSLLAGRHQDTLHTDIPKSRAEFAMLELARARVHSDYVVSSDPLVVNAGGGLYLGVPAGAYLQAAEQNGGLGYSLSELMRQPEEIRAIADISLVDANELMLRPATSMPASRRCRVYSPGADGTATFPVNFGRTLLLSHGSRPVLIGLRRFASGGTGAPLAKVRPNGWVKLDVPADAAPQRWQGVADGRVTVCPPV